MIDDLFRLPPFHQWLGVTLTLDDPANGVVTLHLPYRPEFTGDATLGVLHGGIIATLADIAAAFAVIAVVGRDAATMDLHVDYLRPAPPAALTATARVIRVGRTVGHADVDVTSAASDKRVAVARAKIAIPPLEAPGKEA